MQKRLVGIRNKLHTCGLDEGEEAEDDTGEDEQSQHRLKYAESFIDRSAET